MSTTARVELWGTAIGAVSLPDDSDSAEFEYSTEFLKSQIEPSPLMMPLDRRIYRFPALTKNTFKGLPGMLADSLPDKFGNALIDLWLSRQGREGASFNAVERLCYTGTRGMGALEYFPNAGPGVSVSRELEVDRLVQFASDILSQRDQLEARLTGTDSNSDEEALRQILIVGTSAGGARAKALIAWNPQSGEVRSGQVPAPEGFGYWLIKFDGVSENRDKELADPRGFGLIEYVYSKMAGKAGILMSDCRILEEHNRHHFVTRRFDRKENGEKCHMQSLAALGHYDFNAPGTCGYEQAFQMIRNLNLGNDTLEQQYRRMVFNIVARNQDDHVKNIAFLMDRRGRWALSPAYDITWSYNPKGAWTGIHQMSMNGKRDGFTLDDFKTVGDFVGLKRGQYKKILEETCDIVGQWPKMAREVGVSSRWIRIVGETHRLKW